MFILDASTFCQETATIWQFIGWVLFVFKIVIPLLLILFGMIDLGKAVVASDKDAIKNATSSLVKRAIAAIVIFFLPTIIAAIFGIVTGFQGKVKDQYDICAKCISRPYDSASCDTSQDPGNGDVVAPTIKK